MGTRVQSSALPTIVCRRVEGSTDAHEMSDATCLPEFLADRVINFKRGGVGLAAAPEAQLHGVPV